MTLGQRIKEARKLRGNMSRKELARRTGIPYPTLAGIENEDQIESTQTPVIAEVLGVNARWLATGKGPRDAPMAEESEWDDIRGYAQAADLGDGAAPDEYAEAHKLKFRASSLRRRGLQAENLAVYYGAGDSMEPVIQDGDAVMFDRSQTRPKDDELFVVRHEGHYLVKRLQKIGGTWCLVSENRADPKWRKPVAVQNGDDFEIVGKVVWIARWVG